MKYPKNLKLFIIAAGLAAIGATYGGTVFASHSFELGVAANSLPSNTHIRLDGLTLPPKGVLPLYDASPNFVAGHFLMKSPCDPDTHVPKVTVIAGHIDESANHTYVDKVPLYYIDHASTADSCVYHAHLPDPLNGGAARVTDVGIVNLSGADVSFNPGDIVDINVQRVLGKISDAEYETSKLPSTITHGNPVYDVNDDDPDNNGLGFMEDE